jgi:hypothetical protein
MFVARVEKEKRTPYFLKGNLKKIDYYKISDLGRDNIKIN